MNPYGDGYVNYYLSRITEDTDIIHHPKTHTITPTTIPITNPMLQDQATITTAKEAMDIKIILTQELRTAVHV